MLATHRTACITIATSRAFVQYLFRQARRNRRALHERRNDMGERMIQHYGDALLSGIPLGRAGLPEDVGKAAVYLAADADFVTGKILRIDGGAWM